MSAFIPEFAPIVVFNMVVLCIFTVCLTYQAFYVLVGIFRKPKQYTATAQHRFAAISCGRNEAGVIAQLVKSLKDQDYPEDLIDIYVVADNCTDNTAVIARQAGATVFVRNNKVEVGKCYALDYALKRIFTEHADRDYAGILVFDSDNLVDPGFVAAMNAAYDSGEQICTSYRNTKNYGTSWVTMGCSLWFLREARYLSYSRSALDTSCLIGGTGFMVAADIIRENGGWPFTTLTEDIQFSVDAVSRGYKIAYCHDAIIYDEQPVTLGAAWTQRLRWSKGFYQVLYRYFKSLVSGIFRGTDEIQKTAGATTSGKRRFSCYDVLMTISPMMAVTFTSLVVNVTWLIAYALGMPATPKVFEMTFIGFVMSIVNTYLMFFALGTLTLITEHKRVHATRGEFIKSVFVFPIFMYLNIFIAVQALVAKVSWKPIKHTVNISMEDMVKDAAAR